jgi:predicted ATP-dependent endonuclease of OLD family
MQIIKDFEIRSFRSIRHCKIEDLADFSILSGLNNSGKSNFLRALNLFFRGEPEPGAPINLQRDFYRGDLSSKKRKQISVSAHFTLPQTFRFRRGLESLEQYLRRDFWVHKTWRLDELEPELRLNNQETPLDANGSSQIRQFLSLITFRYIPNRVIPIEIIRQEQLPSGLCLAYAGKKVGQLDQNLPYLSLRLFRTS